jgi:hypothetical protein
MWIVLVRSFTILFVFALAACERKEVASQEEKGSEELVQPGLPALPALRGPQEERSFASSMENVARSARLRARLTNVSSIRLR